MALKLLFPPIASSDASLNVVVIPGIGVQSPSEWRLPAGHWLEELRKPFGDKIHVWHFAYEDVKGQPIVQSLMQQSHRLTTALHTLNPRDASPLPIIIVGHSVGGCIWKQAYANMNDPNYRHENRNVLDHVHGTVFLGTPNTDAATHDVNLLETMVRACSKANVSFISFTKGDNEQMARFSHGFKGYGGQVVSAFETVESRYPSQFKRIWNRQFPKSRIVITREFATLPPDSKAITHRIHDLPKSHEDAGKVEIGSPLYKDVANMLQTAVRRHEATLIKDTLIATSKLSIEDYGVENSDVMSLRSHRSRMAAQPVALSTRITPIATDAMGFPDQQSLLEPTDANAVAYSKTTPSATAGDSSQFSYELVPGPDPPPLVKPPLSIPCFSSGAQGRPDPWYERDDVLRLIDKTLLPSTSSFDDDSLTTPLAGNLKTFAICGAGGLGKTSIAAQYMYSRRDQFGASFWVTADNRNVMLQDFSRIARDLGLQDNEGDLATASDLVKGWLCNPVKDSEAPLGHENEVSWLLVLDNVDDWGVIEDFWPTTGIGSILITSRDPLSRSHVYTAKTGMDLEPLTPDATLEFLDVVAQTHFKGDRQAARAVADWCGGLPLVIKSVASRMAVQDLTFNNTLSLLKSQGFKAVSVGEVHTAGETNRNSVTAVIGLDDMDSETRSFISILAFLSPDNVPRKIFENEHTQQRLEDIPQDHDRLTAAQTKLEQNSLIRFNKATETISMHRIYQNMVRASLEPEHMSKALSTTLKVVSRAWIYQELEKRFNTDRHETCSVLFPHVDQVFRNFGEAFRTRKIAADQQAATLFNDAGWYWFERGLPQESKPFFVLAQSMCEALQQLQPSREVAELLRQSHNNQGSAANETNDQQDSLQHNLTWLSMTREQKNADGTEDVNYESGLAYQEVGVSYACSGMYALALDHFHLCISTWKKLPEYQEKWLSWPMPNIGIVRWVQGDYKAALEVLNKVRAIHQTAFGDDDAEAFKRGKILLGLGNVHFSLGDLDRALSYHSQCLSQWSKAFDAGHHRVGDVCHKLAQDYMGKAEFGKAQEFLSRALRIFALRPYHKPEHARTIFRQGQLFLANGKHELAEQQFKVAHKKRLELVPRDIRSWDELQEADYDNLVVFWSR